MKKDLLKVLLFVLALVLGVLLNAGDELKNVPSYVLVSGLVNSTGTPYEGDKNKGLFDKLIRDNNLEVDKNQLYNRNFAIAKLIVETNNSGYPVNVYLYPLSSDENLMGGHIIQSPKPMELHLGDKHNHAFFFSVDRLKEKDSSGRYKVEINDSAKNKLPEFRSLVGFAIVKLSSNETTHGEPEEALHFVIKSMKKFIPIEEVDIKNNKFLFGSIYYEFPFNAELEKGNIVQGTFNFSSDYFSQKLLYPAEILPVFLSDGSEHSIAISEKTIIMPEDFNGLENINKFKKKVKIRILKDIPAKPKPVRIPCSCNADLPDDKL